MARRKPNASRTVKRARAPKAITVGEAYDLGPDAIAAGRELGEAVLAIRAALSSGSPGGVRVTAAEAKGIYRQCKQALVAIAKLMAAIAFARRS